MKSVPSYKKRGLFLATILLVILLLSVLFLMQRHEGHYATITKNGTVLYEIDLSAVTEPYQLSIDGHNQIEIGKNSARMIAADCPDKLCVKMSSSGKSLLPIVCLPNQVTITFHDNENASYDALTY